MWIFLGGLYVPESKSFWIIWKYSNSSVWSDPTPKTRTVDWWTAHTWCVIPSFKTANAGLVEVSWKPGQSWNLQTKSALKRDSLRQLRIHPDVCRIKPIIHLTQTKRTWLQAHLHSSISHKSNVQHRATKRGCEASVSSGKNKQDLYICHNKSHIMSGSHRPENVPYVEIWHRLWSFDMALRSLWKWKIICSQATHIEEHKVFSILQFFMPLLWPSHQPTAFPSKKVNFQRIRKKKGKNIPISAHRKIKHLTVNTLWPPWKHQDPNPEDWDVEHAHASKAPGNIKVSHWVMVTNPLGLALHQQTWHFASGKMKCKDTLEAPSSLKCRKGDQVWTASRFLWSCNCNNLS